MPAAKSLMCFASWPKLFTASSSEDSPFAVNVITGRPRASMAMTLLPSRDTHA